MSQWLVIVFYLDSIIKSPKINLLSQLVITAYICGSKIKDIMGRAFEFRKERKFKRWAAMAKTFTKIGREIAMSVKEGGPNPDTNTRLRMAMQNARAANMPKVNVENAIKKASSKDAESFTEIIYEGYASHGVAVLVETATDNANRTVANVRSYFNKNGGSLSVSGSVDYLFVRKGLFKVKPEGLNLEDLELELIDFGLDEMKMEDEDLLLYSDYDKFGILAKGLEEKGIEVLNAELVRIPTLTKQLSDEQVEEVIKLIDKLEEDEDVTNVFHTMDMS
jgi:YebC/PmpR family DNA-binding regulatory protein